MARLLPLAALCVAALAVLPSSASAATCSDYSTQAAAQRAGDTRDADGDGRYCEALPCPCWSAPAGPRDTTPPPPPVSAPRAQAVITRVVDGDTVRVRTSPRGRSRGIKTNETVRLIGVDTPETVRPGREVECGGLEAKDFALRLAFGDEATDSDDDGLLDRDGKNGARVTLRTDPSQDRRDRYGRLLAYVDMVGRRRDVGRLLVRAGWGAAYVYRRPFARLGAYRREQRAARAGDRGVWGECDGRFHAVAELTPFDSANG